MRPSTLDSGESPARFLRNLRHTSGPATTTRLRRRNRVGKYLAAGITAATAVLVLTVALSANVTFSRRAAKARGKVPSSHSVPKEMTDLKSHKFPPADMGVNGTDGHVCCQKPWTAYTDPMADACNCAPWLIYEPTNFCSQTEGACATCLGAWCVHDALPTATPTSAPTYEPTISSAPTASPTAYAPSPGPTAEPIPAPTASPLPDPTASPIPAPSPSPIAEPTKEPTVDRTVGTL